MKQNDGGSAFLLIRKCPMDFSAPCHAGRLYDCSWLNDCPIDSRQRPVEKAGDDEAKQPCGYTNEQFKKLAFVEYMKGYRGGINEGVERCHRAILNTVWWEIYRDRIVAIFAACKVKP
jgi:hypothetical protein